MNDEILTVIEAAAYLKISTRTLNRWIYAGKIAYIKLGETKGIRIKKSELDSYLNDNTTEKQETETATKRGRKKKND